MLIQLIAGLVLLTAASLKLAAGPVDGWGLATYRAVIVLEISLGLGLLLWPWRRQSSALGCLCFSAFAVINLYHAFAGRTSCGCFGGVTVNPWSILAIDSAMAVGLGWSSRHVRTFEGGSIRWTSVALCLLLVAAGAGAVIERSAPGVRNIALSQFGTVSGKLVILEPERWIDQPFALTSAVLGGDRLKRGRWILILFHHDCSVCRGVLPLYRTKVSPDIANLGLIELPPFNEEESFGDANLFRLPADHEWFTTTPVVLLLREGKVLYEVSGQDAADVDRTLHVLATY